MEAYGKDNGRDEIINCGCFIVMVIAVITFIILLHK